MQKSRKFLMVVSLLLTCIFAVAGCGGGENVPQEDKTAGKETVKLLYVQWACATATTHVVADVLENKMGYDVEMLNVAAGPMYQGLASGEGDASFCSWQPVTHGEYLKEVGDKVEDLGSNMDTARIGLVVPEYVTINSIEEMNSVKDKFKGEIIGIDPGAGIMLASEKAVNDYGLDFDLVEGSDAIMVASLKQAVQNQEWIAVTGWIPHWKFARWDLKFLDDPEKSYGETETINTVVRNDLKEDLPEVYELFNNFKWTADDLNNAMVLAEDMGDSKAAARKWVQQNEELVNSWLPEEYKK